MVKVEETTAPASEEFGYHQIRITNIAPYEPFGCRRNEDTTVPRFFFINRKQDRFTINCNYREHGVNSNGKKYGRFKTLFRFTVTLKATKTNSLSLNVFYHGNIGGRKYRILNITRDPALALGSFPTGLNNLIIHETLSLVKRQKVFSPTKYETINKKIFEELETTTYSSKTAIKLIYALAYPLLWNDLTCEDESIIMTSPDAAPITVKSVRNNYESSPPPVFASPLLRLHTIDEITKKLKIYPSNKKLFKQAFRNMGATPLYYLSMVRGLTDETTQRNILESVLLNKPQYTSGLTTWDTQLTGEYTPHLRSLLKKLNIDACNNILQDPKFIGTAPQLIDFWLKTTPYERNITLTHVVNLEHLKQELVEEVNGRKIKSFVKPEVIKELLDWFNDDDIFKFSEWYKPALEGRYATMTAWMPYVSKNSMYETTFHYSDIDKKSPLWSCIFPDENFSPHKVNSVGFHPRGVKARPEPPISFTPLMYKKFLQHLQQLTKTTMRKQNMEDTPQNRAFTAITIIITMSNDTFTPYNKFVNKTFTLYKLGLHPNLIDYVIRKRLPIKQVKQYQELPLEWVESLLGLNKGALHW